MDVQHNFLNTCTRFGISIILTEKAASRGHHHEEHSNGSAPNFSNHHFGESRLTPGDELMLSASSRSMPRR
jgi:hypothetical protein